MAKKYISNFVKKQKALTARIVEKVLWMSKPHFTKPGITYVKKQHGDLR